MDSIENVVGKFHEGRTWKIDPFSAVKRVKIEKPSTNLDWQVLVFTLPYTHLRSGATSFCDFKKTAESISFKRVFTFFIALITTMSEYGETAAHDNCLTLLETVVNDAGTSVAVRIFFFCNRPKVKAANIVRNMLKLHSKIAPEKKVNPYETHKRCKSVQTWVEYCTTYLGSLDCMNSYNSAVSNFQDDHPCNPTNVFSITKRGFARENFTEVQKKVSSYYDEIMETYHFPNENLLLRVTPELMSLEELFINKRYLPSYFFDAVALPSVKETFDGQKFIVTVPNHVHRLKKINGETLIDLLKRYNKSTVETEFHYDIDDWAMLKNHVLTAFSVTTTDSTTLVPNFSTCGIGLFFQCLPKFTADAMSSQWFTDVISDMKDDPQIKTLLADKHGFDRLDNMKYKCDLSCDQYANRGDFQKQMMKEFMECIINDEDCDVSDPMQRILAWYHHTRDPNYIVKRRKVDPNGSVFLNAIAWKLNFFDDDLHVSTGHPTLMLLQHCKYDAYRQMLDLHVNLIFTGEGATSKSFLFEKMKQMSIPGTISELTYQTARSDAIDGDRNDTIFVFNEAPPGFLISHKNVDPTLESAMKEKLTSMTVRCKTFVKDDDTDERSNRYTISQSIGVMMGATNDDPTQCKEAMVTRFYFGEFEKTQRKNKSIDECMRGETEWADVGKKLLDESLQFFHREHFMVCMVFKMMFCGIFKYPTLEVSDIIYSEIQKSLRKKKIDTSTRFKERYDAMCRIFTIIYALDLTYTYEGGLHYGKPFDPSTLLDIEPLLSCTEEISIFVFSLMSNEIYNPSEHKIVKAIYQLWRASGCKYPKKQEGQTSSDDYNYIKINKTGKKLRTMIQQRIPIQDGRASDFNIKGIIKKMQNMSLKCYEMVEPDTLNATQKTFNDGLPEPDLNKECSKDAVIDQHPDTLFNIQLFDDVRKNKYTNPVMEAIKSCMHKYTRPKKIILGCPRRLNAVITYASVFDTLMMKPDASHTIKKHNPLHKTKESMALRGRIELLDKEKFRASKIKHDLDRIAGFAHSAKIGMDLREHYINYNIEAIESSMVVSDKCIDYPHDIVKSFENKSNQEIEYVDEYDTEDWDQLLMHSKAKRMRVE
jgi:hypothetical protein